jgi:hypothetical protein
MSCEALTDAASGLKKYRLQAGGAAHGGFSAEVRSAAQTFVPSLVPIVARAPRRCCRRRAGV